MPAIRILPAFAWATAFAALAPAALADGKFFSRDRVPPDLPFQQAFLAFDGEEELLLIQPKFEGAVGEFGWAELTREAERPFRGEGFDLPWLTKFRGILAPDRMREDLVLKPAAADSGFRPTEIR